ncbi:ribonuclease E inhibitor RraB [Acinetobacter sp. CAAS 2-6]|uniref:ribonuclease E inhibitor RraB n=1 Tax=Acinetobacter sp. CAAS 2-6 TaxID=3016358 RepID=UPI002DD63125|nr:ribonuclease E inhibitor RraB [Acinetobacter sp. CAAS 2-6]
MTRDYTQYPDDDNGNLLWEMYEDGDDLNEPHEIEFSIVFKTLELAEKCALHLLQQEQKISLFQETEGSQLWVLNAHVNMIPEYQDIQDLEEWFTRIATEFQGEYDGWGCMTYLYDLDEEVED